MRCSVGALVLCVFWITNPSTSEARVDSCKDLIEINEDRTAISWALNKVEQLFVSESEETTEELPQFSERDYWITVQPGRFSNVTCENYQFEDQEIYPIGIVVKPLGILDLPAYRGAGRGTPVLVLTEYGHRKIVRLEDIEPIAENATYIFADGVLEATYCRSTDDCPGNQPTECESEVWKCAYKVGAISGYALIPTLDVRTAEVISAFDQLRPDQILQRSTQKFEKTKLDKLTEVACRPLTAHAYRPGATLHQPRQVALSLCSTADHGILPLKIVNIERAEKLFQHGLAGSFHRKLGTEQSLFEERVRELANKRLIFAKECGEELTSEQMLSLGGSIGVKVNMFDVANFDFGAKRVGNEIFVRAVKADEYLLYTTYFVRPIPLPGVETGNDLWVFDVVFRAVCEDGEPRRRSSVSVFYKDFSRGYVPIGVKEDIFTKYVAEWGEASFTEGKNPAQIYEGHFWVIRDHLAYFYWRDTLRNFLYDDLGVTNELITRYPIEQQPLIRDFFTFLFLSAAFDHRAPQRFTKD